MRLFAFALPATFLYLLPSSFCQSVTKPLDTEHCEHLNAIETCIPNRTLLRSHHCAYQASIVVCAAANSFISDSYATKLITDLPVNEDSTTADYNQGLADLLHDEKC